jgi:hypothetical protein
MYKAIAIAPLLLVGLALTACGGPPSNGGTGDPAPDPSDTAPTPTVEATVPPADNGGSDDFFLRITATMTEVSGEQLTGVLTILEPQPESASADIRGALETGCDFYNATRADDDTTASDAPYFGAATLTVTGSGTWNDEHAVAISTGGYASLGTGTANRVDNEVCTNLLHAAGTSNFATYFPLNHAEGGIEGAIQWSYFGFADLGDGGGVTYSDCSIELSPHAQHIKDGAENGWSQHSDACFIGPVNY